MKTYISKLSLSLLLLLLLLSCSRTEDQSPAGVLRNLQRTNIDSRQFPWVRDVADGKTKRWNVERDGPIPVKLNGSSVAQQAIDEIESTLHMTLFDREAIADLPDDRIARGIIVSEGTAIGPNGTVTRFTCGSVSAQPGISDYPPDFYHADGRIDTRLYVNLSSRKCTASLEIAVHEFGHALGLGNHFPGFGSGAVISASFWQVLYTLYSNQPGTCASDLQIQLLDW